MWAQVSIYATGSSSQSHYGLLGEPVSQRSFLCVSHKCSCKIPCFSLEDNGRKAGPTATELVSISKTKQGLFLIQ